MTKIVPPSGRAPAVDIDALSKSFGPATAISRLSLTVAPGTVFGLLGPNGAGKTTVIRILATLLRPDSGTARVFGRDVVRERAAVRSTIALTGQFASVDGDLTGRENLILLARLRGFRRGSARARADELLAAFGLDDAATRLVKTYSGGMCRRLDLAASVIVRPSLLFLDEPTTGLDPRSRNQVWEIIRELAWEGTTVLLTTQYLEEADRLAGRVAVIDRGGIVAEGTTSELKTSLGSRILRIRVDDPEQAAEGWRALSAAVDGSVELASDAATLTIPIPAVRSPRGDAQLVAAALASLASADVGVTEIGIEQPSLDEVFLAMTGDTEDKLAGTASA